MYLFHTNYTAILFDDPRFSFDDPRFSFDGTSTFTHNESSGKNLGSAPFFMLLLLCMHSKYIKSCRNCNRKNSKLLKLNKYVDFVKWGNLAVTMRSS